MRQLLPGYRPAALPVSAIHPAGRRVPARVRALIDFLAESLPNDPGLQR